MKHAGMRTQEGQSENVGHNVSEKGHNVSERRLSIADALAAFAGQDLATYNRLRETAGSISICALGGCGDFPTLVSDIVLLKRFLDSMTFEAELQAIGIVPDLGAADAVYRDPNCERLQLTGEAI